MHVSVLVFSFLKRLWICEDSLKDDGIDGFLFGLTFYINFFNAFARSFLAKHGALLVKPATCCLVTIIETSQSVNMELTVGGPYLRILGLESVHRGMHTSDNFKHIFNVC